MSTESNRKQLTGSMASLIKATMKIYTKINVFVFKATKGNMMNTFPGGFPICLLSVEGRKSKIKRDVPLLHIPFMDKKILLASQGGLPKNPVWYYNIVSNPDIQITIHGKTSSYKAVEMTDEEKQYYLPHILSMYPDFQKYSERTERNIPIFLCSPVVRS